jgi:hypothetical protein
MKVTKSQNKEIDLTADLQTRGCAVCNHVIKTARDFFAQWQYALASDEKAQACFTEELGFCPIHSWQLHSMSSPWGESIGLAPLTKHLSDMLAKAAGNSDAALNVQNIVRTSESCRVCRMLGEAEAVYIERLRDFLIDSGERQIYGRSQGVCLRHLSRLVETASDEIRRFLLATASRRFEQLERDMKSYANKREAIRRDLIGIDEEDAYMRALIHFVGAKDYSTP